MSPDKSPGILPTFRYIILLRNSCHNHTICTKYKLDTSNKTFTSIQFDLMPQYMKGQEKQKLCASLGKY